MQDELSVKCSSLWLIIRKRKNVLITTRSFNNKTDINCRQGHHKAKSLSHTEGYTFLIRIRSLSLSLS